MEKTIGLALNKFDPIPSSLRNDPALNAPCSEIVVNLASLYHHYYMGSFGRMPPDPDPAHFEHIDLLVTERAFRARGSGLGASTEVRRNKSNELGHAFCRWFLHDHADITYFAHLGDVLGRGLQRSFGGIKVERSTGGSAPDYFCARDSKRIFLAEAKGSHSKISFTSRVFAGWRNQFSCVIVKDAAGRERKIKGYIVATQFATESNPKMKSVLYAEDPYSPGEEPLGAEAGSDLGRVILSCHYSRVAEKLNQPVLAAALAGGYLLPAEYLIRAFVWAFQAGPLQGRRFVGGYFPGPAGVMPVVDSDGRFYFRTGDPLRLDISRGTFIGVEENIFRQVASIARQGPDTGVEVARFEETEFFYSAISVLRDGSVLAPLEFFAPVGEVVL